MWVHDKEWELETRGGGMKGTFWWERGSRERGFETGQVKRLCAPISLSLLNKLPSYISQILLEAVVSLICTKNSGRSLLKCRFLGLTGSLLNQYSGACILTSSSSDDAEGPVTISNKHYPRSQLSPLGPHLRTSESVGNGEIVLIFKSSQKLLC